MTNSATPTSRFTPLAGQGFSYPELKTFAKKARDILLRVPGVAKVDLLGLQEERIFIEVSSAALAERGLSALDIQAALAGQNAMDPAGRIETSERSVRIDVQGGLRTVEDIRELRLRAGQQTFRLGDIADVRRGLEDPPATKTRYQGREAVLLGTTMVPGANVTEVGAAVEQTLKRIEQDLPVGVELGRISDQAQVVGKSIHQFLEALAEAIGIVLVVSLLALGWRAGLVVALTIPMVLAATFFVMSVMGIDLQRISLGALIIALGLLVDDAMIAVEMMDRKLEEGHDKLSAATFAYTSTAFPMLTGTLITVAGFIPVGFAQSQAGEYVSTLFWVTGIALMISWFAAVYFTPWIGYRLLKVRKVKATDHRRRVRQPSLSRHPRRRCVVCAPPRNRRGVDLRRAGRQRRQLRVHPEAVLSDVEPSGDPGRPLAARRLILQGDRKRSQAPGTAAPAGPRPGLRREFHRRRRAALLSPARPAAQEPELCPAALDVEVARGARARAHPRARHADAGLPERTLQG